MHPRQRLLIPALFWIGVVLLAFYPALLLPVARLYHALCVPFPLLAVPGRIIPPLPLALVLVTLGAAMSAGLLSALRGVTSALRIARGFDRRAAPLPPRLASRLHGLDLRERVSFLATPVPAAFCYRLVRPRVAVTAGLVERLDDQELTAVLLHERHHLRRHDPLRYLLLRALAAGLFMVPLAAAVRHAIETRIELAADRAALAEVPRGALAGALVAALAVAVPRSAGMAALSATEARIAHLVGEPELPAFPRMAVLGTCVVMAGAIVVLTALAAPHRLWELVCAVCPGLE